MDDLTFRKTVLADPYTNDAKVVAAASNDPKKQAFWDDIKSMEADLHSAMNVPIPENLAEKLILQQSLKTHKHATKRRPWYLAMAASIVFASVISFSMLNTGSSKLSNDIFAHMSHVNAELMKGTQVNANTVNEKLGSFNGQLAGTLGEIVSANYCYLDRIKSLHVIIRGQNGLTSLFVVPDSITDSISSTFSNATYQGASFILESAKIIIVGENKNDVKQLEEQAKQSMSFSA